MLIEEKENFPIRPFMSKRFLIDKLWATKLSADIFIWQIKLSQSTLFVLSAKILLEINQNPVKLSMNFAVTAVVRSI